MYSWKSRRKNTRSTSSSACTCVSSECLPSLEKSDILPIRFYLKSLDFPKINKPSPFFIQNLHTFLFFRSQWRLFHFYLLIFSFIFIVTLVEISLFFFVDRNDGKERKKKRKRHWIVGKEKSMTTKSLSFDPFHRNEKKIFAQFP